MAVARRKQPRQGVAEPISWNADKLDAMAAARRKWPQQGAAGPVGRNAGELDAMAVACRKSPGVRIRHNGSVVEPRLVSLMREIFSHTRGHAVFRIGR